MIVNRAWREAFMTLSALLLLLTVSAGSAFAQSPTVTVDSKADQVTVQILEPTDLSTVLEAVCRHLQARCDGLDAAAGVQIPPATVTDTWPGVVRKLLEGTGLNHIALSRAGKVPARLLVSERPEGPVESASPGVRAAAGPSSEAAGGQPSAAASAAAGVEGQSDSARQRREQEALGAEPGAKHSPASSPGESSGAGRSSGMSAGPVVPFVPPPGTVATPFLGPDGRPIVVPANTPPGVPLNPFLDPFGNPIAAPPPGSPVGSPFLGPDGKPILTSPLPPSQVPNPFVTPPAPK